MIALFGKLRSSFQILNTFATHKPIKSKTQSIIDHVEPTASSCIQKLTNHKYALSIKARPQSSLTKVTQFTQEIIIINISEVAQQGKANQVLINYLANILEIDENNVSLERGSTSKYKLIVVQGRHLSEAFISQKLKDNL